MQQTAISRFNRTKLKTASILKKERKKMQTLTLKNNKNRLDLFYVECDTVIFNKHNS